MPRRAKRWQSSRSVGDQPAQVSWSQPARRERRLARSTLLVICAFAGAKLISLVQTVVIAQVFGLSSELDAYVAANGLPELIYTLIAGGALAHAFIPVFSSLLARGDRDVAWRTATLVINCVFLVTLLLSLLPSSPHPGWSPRWSRPALMQRPRRRRSS